LSRLPDNPNRIPSLRTPFSQRLDPVLHLHRLDFTRQTAAYHLPSMPFAIRRMPV